MVATRRSTGALKRKTMKESSDDSDASDAAQAVVPSGRAKKPRGSTTGAKGKRKVVEPAESEGSDGITEEEDAPGPSRAKKAKTIWTKGLSEDDDEDFDVSDARPSRAKKMKTASTKKTKYIRNRAKLAKLPEMPLELIYAVTAYLEPLDILYLSRTDKGWRNLLTSRSSIPIWRTARNNVSGLPPCPDDLTEASYARLLFERDCHACGTPRIHKVYVELRKRLCDHCAKKHIFCIKHLKSRAPDIEEQILDLVPSGHYGAHKHGHRSNSRFVFDDDLYDMTKMLDRLARKTEKKGGGEKGRRAFMAKRMALMKNIEKHGEDVRKWLHTAQRDNAKSAHSARESRYAAICDKLKEEGCEDEILTDWDFRRVSEVDQPRELTPQIWSRIRPRLIMWIDQRRAEILDLARRTRFGDRFRQLWVFLRSWKDALPDDEQASFPTPDAARDFACVVALVESEDMIHARAAGSIRPEFEEACRAWRRDLHAHYLEQAALLPALPEAQKQGGRLEAEDGVFLRADAWFACDGYWCERVGVRHPALLRHEHSGQAAPRRLSLRLPAVRLAWAMMRLAAEELGAEDMTLEGLDKLGARFVAAGVPEPRRFSYLMAALLPKVKAELDKAKHWAKGLFEVKEVIDPDTVIAGLGIAVVESGGEMEEEELRCRDAGLQAFGCAFGPGCRLKNCSNVLGWTYDHLGKVEDVLRHVQDVHGIVPREEDTCFDPDWVVEYEKNRVYELKQSRPAETRVRCLLCAQDACGWVDFIGHCTTAHVSMLHDLVEGEQYCLVDEPKGPAA